MLTLEAKKRGVAPKPHILRKQGQIPAVFYGRKEKPTPITISYKDFEKVWRAAGESSVVEIRGDFGEVEALIHDVDFDPVTDLPRHVDFYAFEKGQKVKVKIPLEFDGVAPAIKELGGTLVKVIRDIEVEAEPKHLPHKITVDISKLVDFNSQILAKDAALPSGVGLAGGAEEVLALVLPPKAEEEEEKSAESVDLGAIEISEKRGKEAPAEGEAVPAEATKPKEVEKKAAKP